MPATTERRRPIARVMYVFSRRRGALRKVGNLSLKPVPKFNDNPHVRFRVLVLFVLVLLVARTASAQYQIKSWTTEDGLPQSTVIGIAQTPDGFIWVTTLGGLARFDGTTFRSFDTTTNPELPHSRFAGLAVDATGQLWLTLQTRQVLRYENGTFAHMGVAQGLPSTPVLRIAVVGGRLVVDTNTGVFAWEGTRFVPQADLHAPIAAGLTWVGTSEDREVRWYRDATGLAHRYHNGRLTRTLALRGGPIYEDRSGRVWSLVPGGTLVSDENGRLRTHGVGAGQLLLENLSCVEDPDGTIWFMSPHGLSRFRNDRFTSYTTAHGLPDNRIRNVMRDHEGSHWIGTDTGLSHMVEQPVVSVTAAGGLEADNTYPILQDRQGAIWIGGWPGLTRYADGKFEKVSAEYKVAGANVVSLMEARDGTIWVGTFGAGLRKIKNGRVETPTEAGAPATALTIYQGAGPDMWFGTNDGLVRFRDGRFTPVLRQDGSRGGETSGVYEDAAGTLWVGNIDGLARYTNGVLTQVSASEGFTGRRARAFHQDAAGSLWIGTYDTGLFRYRDGRFARFTTREGLPANGAFRIIEDHASRFWISSNGGIYQVARAELDDLADGRRTIVTAIHYGREDGMANPECNGLGQPAGILARDGRLWFPTQRGVAILDPARLTTGAPAPPVTILDVNIGGFPVAERDRIEIRSGSTEFQARYAALTFVRPDQARFRYQMEGLDADWVEAGSDRSARYANLPYGTFHFRVIAANRDGVWNDVGARLTIAVIPPFYRTTWFALLMSGLAAAAAFGGHRWRLDALERKQAVQQAFARQLIDSQEADRKRIAADLHDGVSQTLVVIRNWARMSAPLATQDEPAAKRMGDIAEAASQALGEVRGVVQDLLPYQLERVGLVESMRETAARVADASGIAITCDLAAVDGRLSPGTQLRLFRVAQEGLNNVVKHSGARAASLEMIGRPAHVQLIIRDNGKGFVPGAVTPTAAGDGFGLVGMAERCRMMGGDLRVDSAPGKGTVITIAVPCTSPTEGA